MVRAKFRVISVTKYWDAGAEVLMYPVNPKASFEGDEEACVENEQFWNSTPAGEIKLKYRAGGEPPEPGDFYYVDLEEREVDRFWKLDEVSHTYQQLDVRFSLPWSLDAAPGPVSGSIKMSISNEAAWKHFGEPGTKWYGELIRAE